MSAKLRGGEAGAGDAAAPQPGDCGGMAEPKAAAQGQVQPEQEPKQQQASGATSGGKQQNMSKAQRRAMVRMPHKNIHERINFLYQVGWRDRGRGRA